MSFWLKWISFFRPVPGWAKRYRELRGGRNIWPVPGKEGKPKLVPFPIEWFPHRLELTAEDDEEAHARGFVFLPAVCAESGEEAAVGVVVSCCRCGIPLHPREADMVSDFDPPQCKRCRWIIKFFV